MRIAFIFHDAEVYGAPKSLLDLIDGIKKSDPHILCYAIVPAEGPLIKELQKREIIYRIVNFPKWVHKKYEKKDLYWRTPIRMMRDNRIYRIVKTIKKSSQLAYLFKKWEIDIIYSNTSVIAVGAIAALLSRKKHIWHIREFREIDQHLTMDWGNRPFAFLMRQSALVIFISASLKTYHKRLLKKVNHQVIHNGVIWKEEFTRLKEMKEEQQRTSQSHPFTFSIVGRISPQKGQEEAIKAIFLLVKEKIQVRLLIAGKGDTPKLEVLIKKLKLESHVCIMGHVDDPFQNMYFQTDVFLMCSLHEAFGRVTIEAMATALPVIGKKTNYSGTVELIQDGITGILYEGNEEALAKKMRELVLNPEKGRKLGEQAWLYAKEYFNREQYVSQIYKLLLSI